MSDNDIARRYLKIDEYNPKSRLSDLYKDVLLNEVLGNIKDPHAEPTGSIPDDSVTKQEIFKTIQSLDKPGLLQPEDLEYINSYITTKPFKKAVIEYLNNSNITPTTIVERDPQEWIIDILLN